MFRISSGLYFKSTDNGICINKLTCVYSESCSRSKDYLLTNSHTYPESITKTSNLLGVLSVVVKNIIQHEWLATVMFYQIYVLLAVNMDNLSYLLGTE